MKECGFDKIKAVEVIKERKERFNEACRAYKNQF